MGWASKDMNDQSLNCVYNSKLCGINQLWLTDGGFHANVSYRCLNHGLLCSDYLIVGNNCHQSLSSILSGLLSPMSQYNGLLFCHRWWRCLWLWYLLNLCFVIIFWRCFVTYFFMMIISFALMMLISFVANVVMMHSCFVTMPWWSFVFSPIL